MTSSPGVLGAGDDCPQVDQRVVLPKEIDALIPQLVHASTDQRERGFQSLLMLWNSHGASNTGDCASKPSAKSPSDSDHGAHASGAGCPSLTRRVTVITSLV